MHTVMFPIVFIKGVVHLLEKGIINVSQRRTSPEIVLPFLNVEMENPGLEWDPSPPPNYELSKMGLSLNGTRKVLPQLLDVVALVA